MYGECTVFAYDIDCIVTILGLVVLPDDHTT